MIDYIPTAPHPPPRATLARTLGWFASCTNQALSFMGAKFKSWVAPGRLSPLQHQLLDFGPGKRSQFEIDQSQLSLLSKLSSSEVRTCFERDEFKTESVQKEALRRLDLTDAQALLASKKIRNPYVLFELRRHIDELQSAGRSADSV